MAGVKSGIVYSEVYGPSYKYHFTWQCCGQDATTGAKIIDWALVSDVGASYTNCNVQIYFYDNNANILDIQHISPWKSNPYYGMSSSYSNGENIDYGRTTCPLDTYHIAVEGYCTLNGGIGLSIAGSWILTDEYIPTPSAISCSTTNIGNAATIKITRYDLDTSVSISYSFGTLSGTIIEGYAGESYSGWIVPTSFYDEMQDTSSKKCTLTAVSTRNGVVTGTEACTFTVTIDSSTNAPSVSAVIVDTNSDIVAITKNDTKFVKGYSNAQITVTATANNGATVSSCMIKNSNRTVNGFTATFGSISDNTFEVVVTDSRGISKTQIFSIDMVEYKNITCTIAASPPTTDGATKITIQGTYTNGSLGATANTIQIQYRYYAQGTEAGAWVNTEHSPNGNAYKAELSFTDLDYKTAYVFEGKATDALSTATSSVVAKTTPVFSWSNDDFEFNVPVNIDGKIEATSAEISGNVQIKGDIDITGDFDLGGELTLDTLTVTDSASVSSKLTAGEIQSNGDISVSSDLNVSGTAVIKNLEVSGSAEFDSNANFQNGMTSNGTSTFNDPTTFNDTATFNGATTCDNLTVTGSLTYPAPYKDYIIERGGKSMYPSTTASPYVNWTWTYAKYASGYVECWGRLTDTAIYSQEKKSFDVPFPVTFANTDYYLVVSARADGAVSGGTLNQAPIYAYEGREYGTGDPRTTSGTEIIVYDPDYYSMNETYGGAYNLSIHMFGWLA